MDRIMAKGQAAVTDALYFLLIVTGITIFLFGFANNYGVAVDAELVKNYNVDFTTDALKTILYSSVPRDTTQDLYEGGSEIDHLLAYVKEDFSDDLKLEDTTKVVLAKNVKGIMNPVANNFDYLFVLSVPEGFTNPRTFVFVFFHKSNLIQQTPGLRNSNITIDPNANGPFTDYVCQQNPDDTGYENLKKEIDQLLSSVGDTSQSSSKVNLPKTSGNTFDAVQAQAELTIWNATFTPGATSNELSQPPWNCIPVDELVPTP